jgi:hypothetical protein
LEVTNGTVFGSSGSSGSSSIVGFRNAGDWNVTGGDVKLASASSS